ncbi:MAG: hypothetical protein ABSA84_06640 [Gammaproteobacteria bacterium]|jgi:hypothetical protein
MALYRSAIKQLFVSMCCVIFIIGCNPNIDRNPKKNTSTIVEEYVNRVIKRLLIVDENTELPKLNVSFKLDLNDKVLFKINPKKLQIIISKGVLENLQDEAELAAILAMALGTLEQISPDNFDEKIINHMYKAGYDPIAFVELQEEYLANEKIENMNDNWLKFLFSINSTNLNSLEKITPSKINANKKLVLSLSRGMQRAKQRYFINMRLLKKLD